MISCKKDNNELQSILLKDHWDIHRKDIETVSYSYKFKKNNIVEYYVYDRIEKNRKKYSDGDNIIENT